jgi:hypothetical protein
MASALRTSSSLSWKMRNRKTYPDTNTSQKS